MQNFDLVAEQGDAAGTPVVPGVAIFESVDTAQFESAGIIPGQTHRGANNGFIEKLETLFLTGIAGGMHADFPRFQAIEPEPDAKSSQDKEQ